MTEYNTLPSNIRKFKPDPQSDWLYGHILTFDMFFVLLFVFPGAEGTIYKTEVLLQYINMHRHVHCRSMAGCATVGM